MYRRATTSLLLLVLFAALAHAGDDPIKVPFDTIKTQHMVVMVKINDKGPYRLIFDTGAPITLLSSKVAKESGVLDKEKGKGKEPIVNPLLGPMPQNNVRTLEMGDLKVENLGVMVMDHPTVALIDKLMGPVQGIVGLSLFGKYKMTIDYQAKEMTFEPNNFAPPDIMKNMMTFLLNPKAAKKALAPAGHWGFNVSKEEDDAKAGVNIKTVLPGSPADVGGLKEGDRLLTLDGRWTDTVVDCYRAASFVRPGTTTTMTVLRQGKELELTVKVGAGI